MRRYVRSNWVWLFLLVLALTCLLWGLELRRAIMQDFTEGQSLGMTFEEIVPYGCRRVLGKYPYSQSPGVFAFADPRLNVQLSRSGRVADVDFVLQLPVRFHLEYSASVEYSAPWRDLDWYGGVSVDPVAAMDPDLESQLIYSWLLNSNLDPSAYLPGIHIVYVYNREAIWSIALAGFGTVLLFPIGVMCGLRAFRQWHRAMSGGRGEPQAPVLSAVS